MDLTTSVLIALFLMVATFWFYNWLLLASRNYWKVRGIPYVPGALPIFGNALSIIKMQDNFLTLCKRIYETNKGRSMVGFYNMKKPVLMIRDPDLVKTVLLSSFNNFQHNEHIMDTEIDPLVGLNISFLRGQAWKDSRATFQLAFTSKRLKNMAVNITNVCKKFEAYLDKIGGNKFFIELEGKFLFSQFTTEIAAASVFTIEGNSFADDYTGSLLECMKIMLDPSKFRRFILNLMLFVPGLDKIFNSSFVPAKVDKHFRKLVKIFEEERKSDGIPRNDIFQLLLDLEKEKKISRTDMLAHMFTFFIESFETSSLTLSFVIYELAKHQEIQEEVRRELEAVLSRYDGQLTYDSINELNYTEQVISETLRLFPPGGSLTKACSKKYKLEGKDGLALDVEKDTSVTIPVMGLHMDPEIWENPEVFDPNRFRKDNDDRKKIKFAYLPFSDGPRTCPGIRLAMLQMKAAIAAIVRNHRIELSPKMKEPIRIDPTHFLIAASGGVWIRLRPLKYCE